MICCFPRDSAVRVNMKGEKPTKDKTRPQKDLPWQTTLWDLEANVAAVANWLLESRTRTETNTMALQRSSACITGTHAISGDGTQSPHVLTFPWHFSVHFPTTPLGHWALLHSQLTLSYNPQHFHTFPWHVSILCCCWPALP